MEEIAVMFGMAFFFLVLFVVGRGVASAVFSLGQLIGKFRRLLMGRVERSWRQVADKLGGSLAKERSDEGGEFLLLTALVDGVQMRVRQARVVHQFSDETSWEDEPYTEISAESDSPDVFLLAVRDWARTEGLPGEYKIDAELYDVGIPELTSHFSVHCSNLGLAEAMITPQTRQDLQGLRDYAFTLRDGEIRAARMEHENRVFELENAMRVVSSLAHGRTRLLADWGSLARELGGAVPPAEGQRELLDAPLVTVQRSDSTATMTVATVDASLVTVIEAELKALDVEPFTIGHEISPVGFEEHRPIKAARLDKAVVEEGFKVYSSDEARTLKRLTADLVATLLFLRAESLKVDEATVRLELPGMVSDGVKLRPAIDLVFQLALPDSAGPYR